MRAAGGVVRREAKGGGETEVLVVHRPKYDDWTLPKGKGEEGESDEDCAVREVEEETGFSCVLGSELASTAYLDPQGRPKRVRYWSMTVTSGSFAPNHEVDEIRWLPMKEASVLLTHPHDRHLLAGLDAST